MPSSQPQLLARGPWDPSQIEVSWREDRFEAPAEVEARADAAVDALRERGSPCHDGLSARLAGYSVAGERLELELQPTRWALRLVEGDAQESLTALCVVRDEQGRWLAGRRAAWLATWAGRWALGAGGAVDLGESPAHTLVRELDEEWRLEPQRVTVEALVSLPDGLAMVVGMALVSGGAEPVADHEHDEFAWWPAEIERWPAEADARLRRMAAFLAAGG